MNKIFREITEQEAIDHGYANCLELWIILGKPDMDTEVCLVKKANP